MEMKSDWNVDDGIIPERLMRFDLADEHIKKSEIDTIINQLTEDTGGICRDADAIIEHLLQKALEDIDPMLLAAANMLYDLFDRHWNECVQIAEYDDELRKADED